MKFCCNEMEKQVNSYCPEDQNRFDCPDCLIDYNEVYDEFGIIVHDGGTSCVTIEFCPWCGSKLPESKRELWFKELEDLGIIDPVEQELPDKYRSNKWYTYE